ncbi:hypothetical protein [Cryobacterium aureum]|uniref:hypothetical protein n=1 Tax=Cryobacterium aureum TaxID=995037 RepID=UPI000CF49692|nr:hypothetical protein [Cryobacterium aureum]
MPATNHPSNLTEQNLPVLTNLPAMIINGMGNYGIIEYDSIELAASLADRAFKRWDELPDDPDSIETLRSAVNNLADAISTISGQLMQLERGISTGRIAVADRG